jgi:NitT/TauT family transport system substrate-binding protein
MSMRLLDLTRFDRRPRPTAGLRGRALLGAGVLGAALVYSGAPASAQMAIKFSLDEPLEAASAIFLLPQDKGYFRNEGLDVSFEDGNSPSDPITRVASGAYEMGFADINALIKYRDQNPSAPVKAVFMVYNKPPFAVIGRKSRGIAEPKDLEGKKLGTPPTSATAAQWPLFAKLAGIDATKVSLENIGVPVRGPMLAAGQLDAVLGYSFRVYVDLKDRGVPVNDIVLLPMANYGLKLYGSAIIVNSKFAAAEPDSVSGFLRAFQRGLRETIRNPSAAVNTVLKREDGVRKDVALERLRMALHDNIVTPEVRANGFGNVDATRFEEAIEQLALTTKFKTKPKLDDVFDASFLPAAPERRVN